MRELAPNKRSKKGVVIGLFSAAMIAGAAIVAVRLTNNTDGNRVQAATPAPAPAATPPPTKELPVETSIVTKAEPVAVPEPVEPVVVEPKVPR